MLDNSGVGRLTSLFFFLTRNFYPYFFFVCVGSCSEPFYVVNFPHPNSFHQTVVSLPKLIAFLHSCSTERNTHQFLPPVVSLYTQTTNLMYNILYHTNGRESVKKTSLILYSTKVAVKETTPIILLIYFSNMIAHPYT